jgi:phage tail-like protein
VDAKRNESPLLTGTNFLVDWGEADPRSAGSGFAEVVFPSFSMEGSDARDAAAVASPAERTDGARSTQRLVLRRGATGSLDLYHWWDEARRTRPPRTRTVTIQLLADDRTRVALTWRFHGARPVTLTYSPLHAIEASVVMETLELAFDAVEME